MTMAEVASTILFGCLVFLFGFEFRDWIGKDKNVPTKDYTLELTEEELDFVYTRCSRKAERLEEANLKDTPCYRLSWQVMNKIHEARNTRKATKEKF